MRRYDSPRTGRSLACARTKKIPVAGEYGTQMKQWERSLERRLGPDNVGPSKAGLRDWTE